ncbi:hypothetical protein BDZ89DRAFT_1065565 [Hymenopellis radicata]|nr:hypothetical protein BDZ89DRAFT_1065565 [Hymenopellis radicata]
MANKSRTAPATKFYQEDVVKLTQDPDAYGIVLRCWHDAEDIIPIEDDPLSRPLKRGEVGVTFLNDNSSREIQSESDFTLVDRTLQPGDFCKRSIDDVRSGVIVDVKVRGRLEHAITKVAMEGWWDSSQVAPAMEAETRDYVLYDDWVGQIIELYDENLIETSSHELVRFPEFGSHFAIGEKGNILPPANGVQHFLDRFLGTARDTVIDIKRNVYAIAWLAINQTLSSSEAQERQRPARFWSTKDVSKLTLLKGRTEFQMRIGDRVRILDGSVEVPYSMHDNLPVVILAVKETETTVDVLWQDGTMETCRTVDLIPYLNTDEYDCWPGDHVIWRGEDGNRAGVVQTVDAEHRLASLYFPDTQTNEIVSALELDTHGTSDAEHHLGSDGLGVRIGDFVFIHAEGTDNGYTPPRIPRIGEVEAWLRQLPPADGQFDGWHREMWELGNDVAKRRGTAEAEAEGTMQQPRRTGAKVPWIGEVIRLNLDGTIVVTHADGSSQAYPLQRLTKLYDAFEQLEDDPWDGEHHHHHHEDDEDAMMEYWDTEVPQGVWEELGHGDHTEWEDVDEEGDAMAVDEYSDHSLPTAMDTDTDEADPEPSLKVESEEAEQDDKEPSLQANGHYDDSPDLPWKRFDILSSCPVDHAYYASPPAQPSKSFLGRLRKEYRILTSSLPDNIIVRTYEDRTDLLRSLIIGPSNTPYEDAPFVIDWLLDSNFPNSPPQAHFLSWTNGNGRVNPNLYEEGKVCLSILGTWAGDQNEIWSAARSSLLQAFVSIQGLVLVKEPWFCEPAYEKLRGTDEGIVNSRLYSEKAYVLSRGFVRRALEIPLGDLESEIKFIYYDKQRLRKVVADAQSLIEKSQSSATEPGPEDEDLAVPRLTAGGILSLGRTLSKLQALVDAPPRSFS